MTDTKRPTVTQEPTWPEIYMGEQITLTCEIQGEQHTDLVFEWMRTGGDEPLTQNEKKITLEFSFNGEYFWCRGRRKSSPYTVSFWSVPFEGKRVDRRFKSVFCLFVF